MEHSHRPSVHKVRQSITEAEMQKFIDRSDVRVIDPIDTMSDDLFELRYPSEKDNVRLRESFLRHIGRQGLEVGVWIYTEWNGTLQRYPESWDYFDLRTSRNRNLIREDEQKILYDKTIAHGGLSVGGVVNSVLVQSGIGNRRILIDPDTVNFTGLNRTSYRPEHIGLPKSIATARMNVEMDPFSDNIAIVDGFGYKKDVIDTLDSMKPDIFIEEMDNVTAKAQAREYCKQRGIPLVMGGDIGGISVIDIERHDLGGVKPFNGRLSEIEMQDLINNSDKMSKTDLQRRLAKIAGIKHVMSQSRLMESAMKMGVDLGGLPQEGITVNVTAALSSAVARDILLGSDIPSGTHQINIKSSVGVRGSTKFREYISTLTDFLNFISRK